ncbi:MAG: hypothetical protein IJV50_04420 [Lachnospiraceae bacterium]|nr:hypothetical protein [Lachnospiraceae bacterium]
MKKTTYESPTAVFVKTELFENVADQCWANARLYCLVDPSDEENLGNTRYADLANFVPSQTGCNADTIEEIKNYLRQNYGYGARTGSYLTENDISTIIKSGGGSDGQPLKTSKYIQKVRS